MNFAMSGAGALALSFLFYDRRNLYDAGAKVAGVGGGGGGGFGGFGGREAGPVRGYERVDVGKIGGEQWKAVGMMGGGTAGI